MITPVGSEFQVNSTIANHQQSPSTAALSDGGFVVTWMSLLQDGDGWGVFAQRYDQDGNPLGGEVLVNTGIAGDQAYPAVTGLEDGGYLISWLGSVPGGSAILGQRYEAAGTPSGAEFQISQGAEAASWSTVTALEGGGFAASWLDMTGGAPSVQIRFYDAGGAPMGDPALVLPSGSYIPSITATTDGGAVVVWQDMDGDGYGVYGQLLDASGQQLGGNFQVNGQFEGNQHLPVVAALADGGFVVSWRSDLDGRVYAHRYGPSLTTSFEEFAVGTAAPQQMPAITGLVDGGFVIAWMGYDDLGWGIFAQAYDADGLPVGPELLVGSADSPMQQLPTVTALVDGGFVVSWMAEGQGDGWDIFARRYAVEVNREVELSSLIVSETAIENLSVATISLGQIDPDDIDFELVSDGSDGAFAIIGNRLVVVDSSKLDFETATEVGVAIRGHLSDGSTYDRSFTLSIEDEVLETRLTAGQDVRVNTTTLSDQYGPSIAALGDGGFIVAWESLDPNLISYGIYGQRFDASGIPVGDEFRISSTDSTYQIQVSVGALADGGFAVSWRSSEPDGSNGDVFARRFDAVGAPVGDEFLVNSATASDQYLPSLAGLEDGGFVVTWSSFDQGTGNANIYAQRFDASGAAMGGEFQVNSTASGLQQFSSVTSLAGGGFLISWTLQDSNSLEYDVFAQRYDASGAPVGGEVRLNTTGPNNQAYADVAALSNGGFVAAWQYFDFEGSFAEIHAQLFDINGAPIGAEFQVNSTTFGNQSDASITATHDGGFIIAWTDYGQGETNVAAYAQRFDANGNPVGSEFRLDDPSGSYERMPVLAPLADGGFATSWIAYAGNEDANDIRARVFAADGGANAAPIVETPIADQASPEDEAWTFVVPGDAFSDPDSDTLTFAASLDNGDDLPNWLVFDAETRTFAGTPPADFNGTLLLRVTASDGEFSARDTFKLLVTPVNDAPIITSDGGGTSAFFTLPENSTAVTTVAAVDADGDDISYSIVGGNDAALFQIDADTGVLRFIDAPDHEAPADFAEDNFYTLEVAANDGGAFRTQRIEIFVTDVNEGPQITSNAGGPTAVVTVNENSTIVTSVAATDPEAGPLTYSISGGADAARFAINAATGALTFVAAPNFEVPVDAGANNVYDVVVTASDGALSDTQAIAVTVANVVDGVTLTGTKNANTLTGTAAEDSLFGLGGHDSLAGLGGADRLEGGEGNDSLTGGAGADMLIGGEGQDRFIYTQTSDSVAGATDRIEDFSRSQKDKISLSSIDANIAVVGDQSFAFIGTGTFSGSAGQLRYEQSGGVTTIMADTDGDRAADLVIQLTGSVGLVASDFLL